MKHFAQLSKFAVGIAMAAGALALAPSAAMAGTSTGNLAVSATVINDCLIVPGTLAFGNYDPTLSTPTNATANMQITCTMGDSYTVALGVGTGVGATDVGRKMTLAAGSTTLTYGIYSDTNRTVNWGGSSTVSGTGTGALQTLTAYGQIAPQQAQVTAGVYTDTVVATVNY